MLSLPSVVSINHVLKSAPWALQRLAPHAGKIIAVRAGPVPLRFCVDPSGQLRVAAPGAEPDVTIEMSVSLLLRAAIDREAALNDAVISGDTSLAQTLAYVAQNLQWDYEEDLSKVVGDIAAHRIGSTARNVSSWAKDSANNFLQMSKDFWTEERPTIAKSADVAAFISSVDELRDAVARLEKRIEMLGLVNRP